MTTANPQPAFSDRLRQAWRGFRRWRRSRPFWGGLFTALAGLEIFFTTQMSLSGLTFQTGPTGFLSWLIPTILVACGMLLWFSPQQRMFYAIVGAVTAVFSLIGVNLGGFFIGLLLGMLGSALGFAWVPHRQPTPVTTRPEAAEPSDAATGPDVPAHDGTDFDGPERYGERASLPERDEATLVDDLMPRHDPDDEAGGPPRPRNPLRDPSPPAVPDAGRNTAEDAASTQALPMVGADGRPRDGSRREAKLLAVTLVLLSVSAAGALALRGHSPAQAAPATACPTPSGTGTKPATPAPSASRPPGASPAPSPSPTRTSGGNVITDIIDFVDGIGDFLTGGGDSASGGPTTEPGPKEGATPTASSTASGRPTGSAKPSASATSGKPRPETPGCATPKPTKPGEVEPGEPLPRIAPEPGQPRVAAEPSKLTGSKVTMTGLRFDGILDLPTDGGTLKVLKFSMDKAVTHDFLLQAGGPGGKTTRYATDELTVQGDVAFYATRFVGKLLGIEITLKPNLPLPDGLPVTLPISITFTDPVIDLAYVDSNVLTARPALKLDLG